MVGGTRQAERGGADMIVSHGSDRAGRASEAARALAARGERGARLRARLRDGPAPTLGGGVELAVGDLAEPRSGARRAGRARTRWFLSCADDPRRVRLGDQRLIDAAVGGGSAPGGKAVGA